MKNNNKKKTDQLGIPLGTATSKLRKIILFSLVRETGKDICFRCGKKIENIDDFSIEHIIPWLDSDNPKELFFALSNITYSHLACNIRAGRHHKRLSNEERQMRIKERNRKQAKQRSGKKEWQEYQKVYHKEKYHSDPEFKKDRLARRKLIREHGTSAKYREIGQQKSIELQIQ